MEGHDIIIKSMYNIGKIYTKEDKKGMLSIDGVFVCNIPYLAYGYDISSNILKKEDIEDKDKVLRATSKLWRYSKCIDTLVSLIKDNIEDVKYVMQVNYNVKTYKDYDRELSLNLFLKGDL